MKKYLMMATVLGAAVLTAAGEEGEGTGLFDGGWRISGGAVFDAGVKTHLNVKPMLHYVSPYQPGLSREEAMRRGGGTRQPDGTILFDGGSWYNPNDPDNVDDAGLTKYYGFVRDAWDGGTSFSLGQAEYGEVETFVAEGTRAGDVRDSAPMPGFLIQLDRNLYHDAEHGWGVDLSFAFQFFRRRNAVRSSAGFLGGESRYHSGTVSTTAELPTGAEGGAGYDEWNWDEGMNVYGYGPYTGSLSPDGGFAGPIRMDWVNPVTLENPDRVDTLTGGYRLRGDYRNLELMLLARPYYDVLDWLRVTGTLGVVCSRQDMKMSFSTWNSQGMDYRSHRDFREWDVYGVAGLGMMVYYRDFTLGFDFLARFRDDELDIRDRAYEGHAERGAWMFRLALGYEF